LESIFNKNIFFTNNGRSALYVILKALNLPKGSKIGVPLYSCTVVFDAIVEAGYVPYFIDIELDNYTLSPCDLESKVEGIDAVVVIHTFGYPAEMDTIKKVASNKPVIEDCAHSLLSRYKGKITGVLSFASFFSFKKYTSTGEGGMIILNEDKSKEQIQKELNLLNMPSKVEEIYSSFVTYIHSFLYHKPWFGLLAFPMGSYVGNSNLNKRKFKATKIKKSDLSVFLKKITDFEKKVEQQRKNTKILTEELKDSSLIILHESKDVWWNCYLFPIQFESKNRRDKAHKLLREMDIDTAKLYSTTPRVAKKIYGYKGDCPNSEKCAETLLVIPNYYTLKYQELLKIAKSIRKVEELI
jgi:dTDP-4-amino-4,6-dideoxygalactose transaminase